MEGSRSLAPEPDGAPRCDISFLVVSWQTRDLTVACLARLKTVMGELGRLGLSGEVIAIDNASDDGTQGALKEGFGEDDRFRLIFNATNLNFSGGNNQAYRASRGRYLVVLNPDVLVTAAVLREALDQLETHPEAGVVSCLLEGADGRVQALHRAFPRVSTILARCTRWGRWLDRATRGLLSANYRLRLGPGESAAPGSWLAIDQAAGSFLVLRRTTVARVGGYLFDETMPLLFNDVDLSRRVHRAALEVHLLTGCRLRHQRSSSLKQVETAELQLERWRGALAYFAKHESNWKRSLLGIFAPQAARKQPTRAAPGLSGPTPLVSVVIPAYNYGHWLGEAIESALAQTYSRVEVLVVDDGSTDETRDVVAAYEPRVRYLYQENQGLSAARNTGARACRGELIVYLDADNQLAPHFIEQSLACLLRNPHAAFAYPQRRFFGGSTGETSIPDWNPERLKQANYIDACALVHVDLVRRFPFDIALRIGWEDWDFWLTLAENGYEGRLVDESLVLFRKHGDSMSAQIIPAKGVPLRATILRKHKEFVGYRRWLGAEIARIQLAIGLARRRWGLGRRLA